MTKFRWDIKTVLVVVLFISFTIIKGCNDSNIINKEGVTNSSLPIDENGKISTENDALHKDKEYISEEEPDNFDKLKELIKEGISKRTDSAIEISGVGYKIIGVYGGDLSGDRKANAAVDIGFGDREYWAFTNEYGQLIYVYAEKIIPQDENNESVNKDGRYFPDEAKVAGTEREDLDEGHVIADSLGGVSNAYNITPQNSSLNRHGDQAYMEKVIRDAGGCEEFIAIITYPDTTSQIPSHYHFEYIIKGEKVADDFDNVDPDEINNKLLQSYNNSNNAQEAYKNNVNIKQNIADENNKNDEHDLSRIDLNGDGKVTIAEAKAAGYKMPIYSDHWLYPYMNDRDGDGMVGE